MPCEQIPRSCWYHKILECGSDEQAFGLAGMSWPCGPNKARASSPSSCPQSNWPAWVPRQCQVPGSGSNPVRAVTRASMRSSDGAKDNQTWGADSELHCKPQSISLIALDRCIYCGEKDVILTFSGAMIDVTLSAECPLGTHVGNVSGLCSHSGWTILGFCTRKTCPPSQTDFSVQIFSFLTTPGQFGGKSHPPWPELDSDFREYWVQNLCIVLSTM